MILFSSSVGGGGENNNKTKSKEETKKAQMLLDVHNIQQSGRQTARGSGPASWTSPRSRVVEASVVVCTLRALRWDNQRYFFPGMSSVSFPS